MYKILFSRSEKAMRPGIEAYIEYFNQSEEFEVVVNHEGDFVPDYSIFDVVWECKGIGGVKKGDYVLVHEYNSLSTAPFPKTKNILKVRLNTKPDMRVFLNKFVAKQFHFKDDVPTFYRDIGIDPQTLTLSQHKNNTKEYDFVYLGAISKAREIDQLLKGFITSNTNKSFLLIGDTNNEIYDEFKNEPNIVFTGRVPFKEVAKIAVKAKYGINYIPDRYPFNIQTSTKLLEYMAMDLKIITTDYQWVRDFEKTTQSQFFYIDDKHPTFEMKNIEGFAFKNNAQFEDLYWDNIIDKSGIKHELLRQLEAKATTKRDKRY